MGDARRVCRLSHDGEEVATHPSIASKGRREQPRRCDPKMEAVRQVEGGRHVHRE